jgi:SAM-dependent methyltransferase
MIPARNEVDRHYKALLAANYTWMFGKPFDALVAEQRDLLRRLLGGDDGGPAVDLGCGPGFQTIALAELGFGPVIAIDTSETLLKELGQNKGTLPVTAVCADLCAFRQFVSGARVIVCMGDTLPHLPDRASVKRLLTNAHDVLEPDGALVLTFRDLSVELHGLDRFIPVRSDADRIMTCFLEYGPETVTVHDFIHVREDSGWTLHKSNYQKLRLAPGDVTAALKDAGFRIEHDEASGGMHAIVAKR